jgi:large subunit ribosomal protein L18e
VGVRVKTRDKRMLTLERLLRKKARENKAPIWDAVRKRLLVPRGRRVSVNISRINRCSEDGEVVVVPGKVLSAGRLEKRVMVAAYDFSSPALEKILASGGEAISLEKLVERNPRGEGVKILV